MVGGPTRREAETKADQRTLRSLLKRSAYVTSDLEAREGPDRAREHRIIEQINDGMITADGDPASKRQLILAERAALSRWEDEGGSPSLSRAARKQVPPGRDDGKGQ